MDPGISGRLHLTAERSVSSQDAQTRRQLLKGAIAGAAGLVLGSPMPRLLAAPQAGAPAETLRLSDDLFVIRIPGETNVLAQTSANGVLLVDGTSTNGSATLM